MDPSPPLPVLSSSTADDPSSLKRASARGSLCAEVLSAYDLPHSEPPQCVTLTTAPALSPAVTLKTGPPLARHKNRNSFRFSAPGGSTGTSTSTSISPTSSLAAAGESKTSSAMELVAPLRDLYKSKATIRVVYANRGPLEATYDLNQLRIHESKWLILTLASGDAPAPVVDGTEEEIPPTIRVKLTLRGPYRPEIAAVVAMAQAWFGIVDGLEHKVQQVWQEAPKPPFDVSKVMVLPVPLLALAVVASPVIAAVVMVSLPFLLPVVLILITIAMATFLVAASLFFSTSFGRDHLGAAVAPIVDSLLLSKAGQKLVYDVGPRPTPVSVAKQIMPTSLAGKLVVSLLIDLVGSSSYLLPVVGEGLDIAWAPIQTILVMAMYNDVTPNLKYVSFVEEILPFTDIVPAATIGFLYEFVPQLLGKNQGLAQAVSSLIPAGVTHEHHLVPKQDYNT